MVQLHLLTNEKDDYNIKFLNEMVNCFNININRSREGHRFTEDLKHFASYMRMIGGRLNYISFRANNFGAVPSLSGIDQFIYKRKSEYIEGELRVKELAKYLSERNLPKYVSLSEDATRINGRVQYDAILNQIVGFKLPLDKNGLPIKGSFKARTVSEIEGYFFNRENGKENHPANYVNVVMAQTLSRNAAPFCLLFFGTDNRFSAMEVGLRWRAIALELNKYGIQVIAIGSDSDTRFNSVMRQILQFDKNLNIPYWFNARFDTDRCYYPVQDMVHIGTKLRNNCLNQRLKFGQHIITFDHLKYLIRNVTKEKHKLTMSMVQPTDRQNFNSVLCISNEKVISLLLKIPNTEGTVMYLRLIDKILRSFLDLTLKPLERIRNIWFALFMLRIWRQNINDTRGKSVDQFISHNCYSCIEINAHALVLIILYLKERKLDHLLCPELFGSQPCEGTFRQVRSFGSTYSTVVNCSLLEIRQRMSKIEYQNQILHVHLKDYNFPRLKIDSSSYFSQINKTGQLASHVIHQLPGKDDILAEIECAQLEAIEYASSLGVSVNGKLTCFIKNKIPAPDFFSLLHQNDAVDSADIDAIENAVRHMDISEENVDILQIYPDINLAPFTQKIDITSLNGHSFYIKIRNRIGQTFLITKHTLVWLLSKGTSKLSSDRIARVMAK